ncbi:aminoglycoside phosphotransferase family protein, partial [Nocardioides sp. YIM 152588]|uniref:phosphotransferase family protein n=1 Tax=Nocardioides sp. YIM 152588 TaxID=3158259 RepID=UPI0032E3EDEA
MTLGGTFGDALAGVVGFEPLAGGHSGETFLAETGAERSVVRIFASPRHRPEAPEIQAALLGLVRGLLPVPAVKEVRRPGIDPTTGEHAPGLLVTSFLPGVRGDLLLADLVEAADADALRRVGTAVGGVAATLAGMPTLRGGLWADPELRIEPFSLTGPGWVDDHAAALAERGWSVADLDRLGAIAAEADDELAELDRTCVVHSDLNPKNLLLDPDTLVVTGVLDWEFSHSGHPWTDLGNLLRFDRAPAYVDAVLAAWCDRHPSDPAQVLRGARAADLTALVELAARAGANPVADQAA